MIDFVTCTLDEIIAAAKEAAKTRKSAMEFSLAKWKAYYENEGIREKCGYYDTCPLCKRYINPKKETCGRCPLTRNGKDGINHNYCCNEWFQCDTDNGKAMYLYIRRTYNKLYGVKDGKINNRT